MKIYKTGEEKSKKANVKKIFINFIFEVLTLLLIFSLVILAIKILST